MVASTVTITGHGGDEVQAYPCPEQVAELRDILAANNKVFEEHIYEGAGHAFFSVDRPAYQVAAANDGWERIAAFYGKYLG